MNSTLLLSFIYFSSFVAISLLLTFMFAQPPKKEIVIAQIWIGFILEIIGVPLLAIVLFIIDKLFKNQFISLVILFFTIVILTEGIFFFISGHFAIIKFIEGINSKSGKPNFISIVAYVSLFLSFSVLAFGRWIQRMKP